MMRALPDDINFGALKEPLRRFRNRELDEEEAQADDEIPRGSDVMRFEDTCTSGFRPLSLGAKKGPWVQRKHQEGRLKIPATPLLFPSSNSGDQEEPQTEGAEPPRFGIPATPLLFS